MCYEASLSGRFGDKVGGLHPPVHLDERVYQYLLPKAQAKGVPVDDLVNDLLKKCIELSWRLGS
jgi:hypothetical protein